MSSPRNDSRTNSVYVDAPEFPVDHTDDTVATSTATAATSHHGLTAISQVRSPAPEPSAHTPLPAGDSDGEEDEDEDDEDEDEESEGGDDDQVNAHMSEDRGRSLRGRTPNAASTEEDEDDDDDEEMVMQVDPATGLQRATSIPRVRSRSSSLANRLRRQHQRMSSSSGSSSRVGRPTSSSGSRSASGQQAGQQPAARSNTVPLVDEKDQAELRRKIMDIQRDPTISFADKASMIQKLMSSKWQGAQSSLASQTADDSTEGTETTEEDLKTTYNNTDRNYLGCKHYRRGCKLKANCCGKWFNCRFCHDDVCNHTIVRNETKMMLCMHCKAIQPAAQSCESCSAQLANYYCDICKLWDDDPAKPIYHCADCGICRIGNGLDQDFFHCKKCNICMNIQLKDNHRCIERNLECDCPICGEYMFTSTTTVIFMPCGHCIHSKCHSDYVKTSYQCPTCWKALGDMTAYYAKIDNLLSEQKMPPEYANFFSHVLCNDCEIKSEAPYHFLYHQCEKCRGYNTKVLETFKRVSEGQVQVVENATAAAGAVGTAPENNISGGGVSSAGGPSSSSGATATTTTTPVTTVHLPEAPRSPLNDGNATGDM
ncbi:hypothetical protein EC957_006886 [Mortierella hygrophila]|uniref:Zf-CHY-domain-containing protein n=1 Tax=Mortierella hygrophila TaxID=979708 RepID=A0A9P6EZB0_9FUNG|nr:hypothetical protein EC957_006886 [Mortierella hygrophila]